MPKPRWYVGQTLTPEDIKDIGQLYRELFGYKGCCRDHIDEIEALRGRLKGTPTRERCRQVLAKLKRRYDEHQKLLGEKRQAEREAEAWKWISRDQALRTYDGLTEENAQLRDELEKEQIDNLRLRAEIRKLHGEDV